MIEVEPVAKKHEIELPDAIDRRIAGAEKIGEHKTSMLQDLEAGRPMELDAVAGAVPRTRGFYACTMLLDVVSIGGIK
jgi:2-dehydropantoate 2-reductase